MFTNVFDQFFPSAAVSIITEGRQMIPVLNSIGVHAAVYGNHDFGKGTGARMIIIHVYTEYTCRAVYRGISKRQQGG